MQRVLVVGGSEEYPGAVYLAAMSAMRSGDSSVIVMAPTRVAWTLNALSPDLMTRKLPGSHLSPRHERAILKQLKTADVLVLGNGATTRKPAAKLMRRLMRLPIQKVIDADALKVLKGAAIKNAILTPNEGEWRSLVKNSNVRTLQKHNVIIKKGARTEILAASRKSAMPRVNPGLEKAGMGDVLAGLCAGQLAHGNDMFFAAREACALGNKIADILTKRKRGYFFLASDIIGEMKKARRTRVTPASKV